MKIITIIGAKDGVGVTTFAVELSRAIRRIAQKKVLLVNMSYPSDIARVVRVDRKRTAKEVSELLTRTNIQMMEGLLRADQNGSGLIERYEDESLTADELEQLSRVYDIIIIDSGSLVPTIRSSRTLLAVFPEVSVVSEAARKFPRLSNAEIVALRWPENCSLPRWFIKEKLGVECRHFTSKESPELEPLVQELINVPDVRPSGPQNVVPIDRCFKQEMLTKLQEEVDARNVKKEELAMRSRETLLRLIATSGSVVKEEEKESLIKEVLDEALGLGPLEPLMADATISEVMVNSFDRIYVERSGKLHPTDRRFSSDEQVMKVVERIVAPIGRRIDEFSPMVDARLADGSRVNVIIPPLALNGPAITIRKFSNRALTMDDLIGLKALNQQMAAFLKACVQGRLNVLVSGGTGSGKTTLLNVLSSFIPDDERIITIEDSAELRLAQAHVICLEARPANIEGRGEVTIRDLVRNSLRMRPDRIVVGECRGAEALDMLQAMNTGHDGSLTTIHANSPRDSISRLETLVLFAGIEFPLAAIREQISAAIDLIVQLSRFPDGSRKITHVTEVSGMEGNIITMQDIFTYKDVFSGTGFRPRFIDKLKARGIEVSL